MNNSRKLIVVGQTPPPFNGQAKMIQCMIDGLKEEFDLFHIRMAYSDSVVSAGKLNLSKIAHLFHLIGETRRALKAYPGAVLYYPPASPNLVPVLRDIIFLCAVRPCAGKTVFHFHSGGVSEFIKRHPWLKRIAGKAYFEADAAVELGASCFRDGAALQARETFVVPNGAAVPVRKEGRCEKFTGVKILYVGIHTEEKGLFTLLETAAELKRRRVPFKIRTAGLWYTKDEQARFEEQRDRSGLENDVETVGQKTGEDLWALYAWADLFLFPTFYSWETFGIVQLEAMAYALPVVASDWAGPRDVVLHGQTGFLCSPRDSTAFADAIQRLAENPELRLSMGAAGRKRYEHLFTAEQFVQNMKQVFNKVCA
jgi:glycosyltransferase involved in cell wall biosynthesis